MRKYSLFYKGSRETYLGGDTDYYYGLYQGDSALEDARISFHGGQSVEYFSQYLEAANDALDEIEALVTYNEENNLYATKTYRDMVDILIRADRR